MGTIFTDGKLLVNLTLHDWNQERCCYMPDWSADFFQFEDHDYDLNAYICDDAQYCIDVAMETANGENDEYSVDDPENCYCDYNAIPIRILKSGNRRIFATPEIVDAIEQAEAKVQTETGESLKGILLDILEEHQVMFESVDTDKINDEIIPLIWDEAKAYISYIKNN